MQCCGSPLARHARPLSRQSAEPGRRVAPLRQALPPGFSAHIFRHIYNTELCALFANASTPGFAGHCDATVPAACSDRDRWCDGDGGRNVGPLAVGELVAAQVRRTLRAGLRRAT